MHATNYRSELQIKNYCKQLIMKNNIISDNEISSLFEKDAAKISPDNAIRERLEYTFMLKNSGSKVTQNSFLGIFTWLFSWSQLPAKAAFVSLILLVSLLKIPSVENQIVPPIQDTTFNAVPLHIDSSETSPFFADTCLTTKVLNKEFPKNNNSYSTIASGAFNTTIFSTSNFLSKPRNGFLIAAPKLLSLPCRSTSKKAAPADLNNLARVVSSRLA